MSDYNTDDLMYEVREVQLQNNDLQQKVELLTEIVHEVLATKSSIDNNKRKSR